MNTATRGMFFISRQLRVAAVSAAFAWMSVYCGTVSAQATQPSPKAAAGEMKKAQAAANQAQLLEQLARQIETLKADLKKQRDSGPANDPHAAQRQETLDALLLVQQQALKVLNSEEVSEFAKTDIAATVADVLAHLKAEPARREKSDPSSEWTQLKQLQEQFAAQQKQLAEREKQFATVLAEQRRPQLPPLDNGTVKIYRFAYTNARDASKTVESLFGTQSVRVSVDERNNLLIAYGKPEIITALDALLSRFDEQASPDGYTKSTKGMASPRSLMLRVFWLADSVPETVGQNPSEFLPKSVLDATHKLGLEAPRLVTQTVTALATGKDDAVDFSSNVPALLLDQPVGMSCEGKLKLVADDRVRVDMGVNVGGQSMNCDLRGSMATPLGHYMVLGTANSMIADGDPMAGRLPGAAGMGMMGRGRMGPGGGFGRPGAEFGPEGGAAAPGSASPGGEFSAPGADPNAAQPAKPKYATSRFAFVVQVVEGQSYSAEKVKPEGE